MADDVNGVVCGGRVGCGRGVEGGEKAERNTRRGVKLNIAPPLSLPQLWAACAEALASAGASRPPL